MAERMSKEERERLESQRSRGIIRNRIERTVGRSNNERPRWTKTDADAAQVVLADLKTSDSRISELERREQGMFAEFREIESVLAEALNMPYDEEMGWVTGEHTEVTLAMTARRRMGELREALHIYLDGELRDDLIRRMARDALRNEDS